jgi:NAD(P)-dependent dehydrogenase (short-subunit alcohol dehydrogenase family)
MIKSSTSFLLIIFSQISFAAPVVLVTGASQGIGLAIVEKLAAESDSPYEIYAGVRSSSDRSLIDSLQAKSQDSIHIVELDVTNASSVKTAVHTIIEKEGHIDYLVNNAGIMIYGSVENVSIEEAQRIFEVNFFGVMRVTQEVLPYMRAQKFGRIIQVSSRSGFRPYPSLGIYAASKFALTGLSETMASQLKPWNIHVSLIEPGPVKTSLDFVSPYGSRLLPAEDPYLEMFKNADALYPDPDRPNPSAQEPSTIAIFVKRAMEDEVPLFRYQTAHYIEEQAALRAVDITGLSQVEEMSKVLGTSKP